MVSRTRQIMNRGDKFLNSNYKNFVKAKVIEERKINAQKR